jgi:DNA-binding response OmpR family regulator
VLTGIRRSSDVPIVLLTGGGRWSDESRAQGSEATLRLPKPFSMEAVMGFARRALDGDEPIPASGCAGDDGVDQPSDARMPDR